MAAMQDVWGNKTQERNAPRRLSKKKQQRVTSAWTRVMDLLVEQGAAGDCPRLLLLAERQCKQLEQQLKETQVQAAKAEKEAKKELEAENRALAEQKEKMAKALAEKDEMAKQLAEREEMAKQLAEKEEMMAKTSRMRSAKKVSTESSETFCCENSIIIISSPCADRKPDRST